MSTDRLFDVGAALPVAARGPDGVDAPEGLVVRVLPDVGGIRREFDYVVPPAWADRVAVGTAVRIPLHGRRVAGWVTAIDVEPPESVRLVAITKVSGIGPTPDVIELCRWSAWRWAGKVAGFMGTASPPGVVRSLPTRRRGPGAPLTTGEVASMSIPSWIDGAFDLPRATVRLPPANDVMAVVGAAVRRGDALVICPSIVMAVGLARRLRASGVAVALYPDDWATAAAGATVIGARAAVFAPMPTLRSIVVLDEHDEALQSEGSPTWHAREVALERGRRRGVPVVLVSPMPSLEAQKVTPVVVPSRSVERAGWPRIDIVDRRDDDVGRTGLYSEALVRALRGEGRMLCVLNRTGRSRLSACHKCGSLATCERCGAFVIQTAEKTLDCLRCHESRPSVCSECGSGVLRHLRIGVTRAREELETLLREPVGEVTGATRDRKISDARVLIGTEAILHQVDRASVVAFLEFDQELSAPRYRSAEQALSLLVRAGRIVGGRRDRDSAAVGRVVVQTRMPSHEVLEAAAAADPAALTEGERARRDLLSLPPLTTIAVVGGPAAPAFIEAVRAAAVTPDAEPPVDLRIDSGAEGQWIMRSTERRALLDLLARVERPPGRLRLQIDPMRLPGG